MRKLSLFALAAVGLAAPVLRAEKLPPLPDGAFTYAVVPDTQGYDGEGRHTKHGRAPGVGPTRNEKLDRIVGWLARNARTENIRFVSHTGDITDMNNDCQWRFASNAMARLDGVLPYAVVPGNHDMKSSGDTSLFRRYFPAARFAKNAWYAGTFSGFTNSAGLFVSGDNANSCCLFECGREKFVVLHLECNAPDPVLAWGGRMLEKYADRHAIVATHQDLGAIERKNARLVSNTWGGLSAEERKTWSPDLKLLGRLNWCKCHGSDGNSGADIWRKLSSRHGNVFLVVSGDQGMVKVTRVDEKGARGNAVYSLMQDTGGGYIRLFRFVPAEKAVRCYTVNPADGELVTENGWWHDASWFNFTLPYPAVPADDPIAARRVTWKGVPNVRDLGGLPGSGGKTVRRGRIYRSAGLNDNAHYRVPGTKKSLPKDKWKGPGRTRVNAETIRYVTETLGVRTDLDLRSDGEVFGMTGSPLGERVRWVRVSSSSYGGMDSEAGRAAFARDFRLFLDETNYPVVFHCIAGADRTGSLACILNGLLGVDADLLHRDWQYTWTGCDKPQAAPEKRWNALVKVFGKYKGETLNARIEAYVLSCGITADEIARFRALMLEGPSACTALAGTCSAGGVTCRDSFDDPSTDANWRLSRGFRFVPGAGIGGSRAIVWEESEVRPMPKAEVKSDVHEGNEVGGEMRDGRTRCLFKTLAVEPGCQYACTISFTGQVTNNCGYTFFAWYDEEDRLINSAYGRPGQWKAIWKGAGTNGWESLTTTSTRLPSNAAYGRFYIEVYRTTLGKLAFDDFSIEVRGPVASDKILCSAYRDAQEAGPVRFLVPYTLSNRKYPREKLRGRFTFAGENGPFTLAADKVSETAFEVSVDVARLAKGAHPVSAELFCGDRSFGAVTSAFTRLTAPRATRVRFDPEGRAIVDGKPFFPHGVFVHPADKKLAYLDRIRDSPFNCVIENSPSRQVMDRIAEAGLYALPKPPHGAEQAARVAEGLRNHPALLAWYILDETPVSRAGEKKALHAALRAADPDHPTYAVFDRAKNIPDFAGGFDVAGGDPYPVSSHGDPSHPLDTVLSAEETRRMAEYLTPYWQVPQAFAWDWCSRRGKPHLDRFPTREEMMLMAWQSIAGGANGILWYSANQIFKNARPDELETYWGDLVAVGRAVESRMAYLTSTEPSPKVLSRPANAGARAFRRDGKVVVLVTGRDRGAVLGEVVVEGCRPLDVAIRSRDSVWFDLEPSGGELDVQREIDRVAARGGGSVAVRAGDWVTRPFVLRSNVTLQLDAGATLCASTNLRDYAAMTRGNRYFIYAEDATNVAIVGRGALNGNGWAFRESRRLPGESQPQDLPVMMRFSRCRNVRFEDFTYRDCGAWGLHLRNCDGVTVRNLTCFSHSNRTNDGIDIESSNVTVEGCDLDTGDDAIVFKTESDKTFPVTNVVIRNCRLASRCNALKFGTGSYCDVRDVLVENCEFHRAAPHPGGGSRKVFPGVGVDASGLAGLAVEVVDGGRLEDVTIRNVGITGYLVPVFVRLGRRRQPLLPERGTCLRNVLIENVTGVADSRIANSITGVPGLRPSGITLRNVELACRGGGSAADAARPVPEMETAYPECVMFHSGWPDHLVHAELTLPAWGFYIRHARDIRFENVRLSCAAPDAREEIVLDDVTGFVRRASGLSPAKGN